MHEFLAWQQEVHLKKHISIWPWIPIISSLHQLEEESKENKKLAKRHLKDVQNLRQQADTMAHNMAQTLQALQQEALEENS